LNVFTKDELIKKLAKLMIENRIETIRNNFNGINFEKNNYKEYIDKLMNLYKKAIKQYANKK